MFFSVHLEEIQSQLKSSGVQRRTTALTICARQHLCKHGHGPASAARDPDAAECNKPARLDEQRANFQPPALSPHWGRPCVLAVLQHARPHAPGLPWRPLARPAPAAGRRAPYCCALSHAAQLLARCVNAFLTGQLKPCTCPRATTCPSRTVRCMPCCTRSCACAVIDRDGRVCTPVRS